MMIVQHTNLHGCCWFRSLFGLLIVVVVVTQRTHTQVNGYSNYPIRHCTDQPPRHITLAVGNDPSSEMIITFATATSNNVPAPIGGVLISSFRGLLDRIDEYDNIDTNDVILFLEDHSYNSPTFYNITVPSTSQSNAGTNMYYSRYYHHIKVTNLQPSTKYYYRLLRHNEIESYDSYMKFLSRSSADGTTKQRTTTNTKEKLMKEFEIAESKLLLRSSTESETTTTTLYLDEGNERLRQRKRNLIQWGPYDSTQHSCPDVKKVRSFHTAPKMGNPDQEAINIAVVGDLGQFPHSREVIEHIMKNRGDVNHIILAGDVAYSQYDHKSWDTFLDMLDDYEVTHYLPMQIVPGNHDIDKILNDDQIFLGYENRFRMPQIHPPIIGKYEGPNKDQLLDMDIPPYPLPYEWGNAYYSYTYGSAHIIMISSYSSMEPDSTQYKWIVSELEKVDRTVTPWVLAVLHTPLYNTFHVHLHDYQIVAARLYLEPLFTQYDVNMVFTGHIHAYLRTFGVIGNVTDETGPVHITVGSGGRDCYAPFLNEIPEPYVAVRDATLYGYGMFRILNITHAEWEWIHTGQSEKHATLLYNEIYQSDHTIPSVGQQSDYILIENQYSIKQRKRRRYK